MDILKKCIIVIRIIVISWSFFPLPFFSVQAQESSKAKDTFNLAQAMAKSIFNPSLTIPFFWGPLYRHVPHVRARSPFGHLYFNKEATDKFTKAAHTNPNGLATYWAGPFPVLYIVNNETRRILVQESKIGIVDQASGDYLRWLSGGNNVMATFPDFRPIDSETYKAQRKFLMTSFHSGATKRLPMVAEATTAFLKDYSQKYAHTSMPLRDFITGLVLHTSSHLLGLDQSTLDQGYFEKSEGGQQYRHMLGRVARYGISERADGRFEEKLFQFFLKTFKENFDSIRDAIPTPETQKPNLIRNIFDSMNVPFPEDFESFSLLDKNVQHTIAMNFASTGLGAMVHSTANTLDWAIARLLNNPQKLEQLVQLMAKHKDLDLTLEGIFDKGGPLFPLSEWILHNVFIHPPFSHEFFLNRKAFTATLPDGQKINVPSMSFIVVNYGESNRSQKDMLESETFCQNLDQESTVGKFVMKPWNSSFGGSDISKDNRGSRKCPGAKISLYEQMIILATILRDYPNFHASSFVSCSEDPHMHPLCSRSNRGDVKLTNKVSDEENCL